MGDLFAFIGRLTVITGGIILFLLLLSLVLGIALVKKKRLIFPRILLFTVDSFYLQFKKIAKLFGLSDKIVDLIGIEVRNHLNEKSFASVPAKERIVVVPQCIRHPKCPARLDSRTGIDCKGCGLCVVKELKEEAENLGYRFFIVPGGSFVKRIVKAVKPKAALGIACHQDLNIGMHEISRAECIVMGVPLLKDGCVNTQVDVKEVKRILRLGIESVEDSLKKGCSSSEVKA